MVETVDRNVSIKILRPKTKSFLSALLNSDKIIPTDNGLQRDWRGLAGLCNINGQYGPSIQNNADPTNMVLSMWLENDAKNSTINKLLLYLEEIDRFDVVDDIKELIDEDIQFYNDKPNYLPDTPNLVMDKYILSVDDLKRVNEGLPLETYDAFVLFADDDIGFATEVIDMMEKQYAMKFFVIDRDLVPGGLKYDVMVRAITERCNRVIVILSDAFFNSDSRTFYLRLAQSYGAESQRKVIPCLYKHCNNLPADMKCYFKMDFRRASSMWNVWDKLRDTIKVSGIEVPNKAASQALLTRTKSDNTRNTLRSALHHETNANTLKPMNQVKFNSMVNLNNYDSDKILPDQSLSASTSANSIGIGSDKVDSSTKKKTKKPKWFKKIISKHKKGKTAELAN